MAFDLGELARCIQGHAPGSDEVATRLTQAALDAGLPADRIVDEGLVAGMTDVGRRFRDNEIFVPEVLVCARAMHAALAILDPVLAACGHEPAGRLLIGTVKGDIHDIGKNLVVMIARGAGFEVRDLGVNVGEKAFRAAIQDFEPDIVGMSALLTTTMPQMRKNLEAWRETGLRARIQVVVGGAPVTESFAQEIGADGYGADAVSAVELCTNLVARRER